MSSLNKISPTWVLYNADKDVQLDITTRQRKWKTTKMAQMV